MSSLSTIYFPISLASLHSMRWRAVATSKADEYRVKAQECEERAEQRAISSSRNRFSRLPQMADYEVRRERRG